MSSAYEAAQTMSKEECKVSARKMAKQFITKYDSTKTGTLSKEEAKAMCITVMDAMIPIAIKEMPAVKKPEPGAAGVQANSEGSFEVMVTGLKQKM